MCFKKYFPYFVQYHMEIFLERIATAERLRTRAERFYLWCRYIYCIFTVSSCVSYPLLYSFSLVRIRGTVTVSFPTLLTFSQMEGNRLILTHRLCATTMGVTTSKGRSSTRAAPTPASVPRLWRFTVLQSSVPSPSDSSSLTPIVWSGTWILTTYQHHQSMCS